MADFCRHLAREFADSVVCYIKVNKTTAKSDYNRLKLEIVSDIEQNIFDAY